MTPNHSRRCRFRQITGEIALSVAKYLLVMAVTVGPIYLIACLLRGDSLPGYITWVLGFVRQYGTLLFVLAAGTILAFYRSVHKSSPKPDDEDQPGPPES